MGGLGNQMFQYAFGICLVQKRKTKLIIDTSLLEDREKKEFSVFREFDLDIFEINFSYATSDLIFNYGCIDGPFIRKISRKIKLIFHKPNVVIQNNHDYNKSQLLIKKDSCIVGRWQSYRYFEKLKISEIFKFKDALLNKNKMIANKLSTPNSVSIHFRRGDYVSNKYYAEKIGALDIEYYNKAVAKIKSIVESPIFYVFSDDIEWVKKNLAIEGYEVVFVEQEKNKRGMKEDLHLMSLCENHIISNSTFAWWGAYLANGKNVIAPKMWAKDKSFVPPYIYPEKWQVI